MSRKLHDLDPRLKVLAGLVFGLLTWRAGLFGLTLYWAGVLLVLWSLGHAGSLSLGMVRWLAFGVLFWTGLKFGFELMNHEPLWPGAVQESLLLGGRLGLLIFIGLAVTASTSTRQLGLAVHGLIRPILGRRAWMTSLGLALMVHFLPLTLRTIGQVRQAVLLRCSHLWFWTRYSLVISTVIRTLGQKTWDQTLGLAARGLDQEQAWQEKLPVDLREWLVGLTVLGCGLAAACMEPSVNWRAWYGWMLSIIIIPG